MNLFNLKLLINSLGKRIIGSCLAPACGIKQKIFSLMSSIPSMGRVLDSVCSFSLMLSEEGLFDLELRPKEVSQGNYKIPPYNR